MFGGVWMRLEKIGVTAPVPDLATLHKRMRIAVSGAATDGLTLPRQHRDGAGWVLRCIAGPTTPMTAKYVFCPSETRSKNMIR